MHRGALIKKTKLLSGTLLLVLIGGLFNYEPKLATDVVGAGTTYKLQLDATNKPAIAAVGFGTGASTIRYVDFSYQNADDDTTGHIKLSSEGGKIHNTKLITGQGVVKAVFSGGELHLAVADTPGGNDQSVPLTSNSSYPWFFDNPYVSFYTNGTGEVTIASISIEYSCEEDPVHPNLVLTEYEDHYEVTGYTGSPAGFSIPAFYRGKFITGIAANAFKGLTTLTDILLPETLVSIGDSAFEDCTELETVNTPEHLSSIGAYAFKKCRRLANAPLSNSLTYMGAEAFNGCVGLTEISIPSSLTVIPDSAFYMCLQVAFLNIPPSVNSIGSLAFHLASHIEEIHIPASVTTMGYRAFSRLLWCTVYCPFSISNIPSGWSNNWANEIMAIVYAS
ncbi:MAG: leucine-rich repeat domain-containing protein [Bacilli bacterium]|jgi:hypothetical protein